MDKQVPTVKNRELYVISYDKPGFSGGSDGKESACNEGYLGLISGSGRSLESYPLQYSCLENSMDRGAWRATVHGVTKSWTRLTHTHIF